MSASAKECTISSWNVERSTLLHTFHLGDVWKGIGSPHHPFFLALGGGQQDIIVCDAELGNTFALPKSAASAAFKSDGLSFLTGGWGEGLTSWDLQTLLELHAWRPINQVPPPTRKDLVELVGMPLPGPQVSSHIPF